MTEAFKKQDTGPTKEQLNKEIEIMQEKHRI